MWKISGILALCAVAAIACDDPEVIDPQTGGQVTCEANLCTVQAGVNDPILKDITFTADNRYLLKGGVFIGDDVNTTVLTIEPGTEIFGETSSKAFLTIRRGSKLIADGTKDNPIVFTSSKPEGQRTRGDWGGVVINGRAPINGCDAAPCEAEGEGGTGKYGGSKADDDSGTLRYVRVEFAGHPITPDNELNGIAFQGVGSGTTIEYLQIHMAADDGIEFFGGTVNFRYVLTTGISDDNLDWTDGWTGQGQFFVAQQYADAGDQGIEADNNGDNNAALPRSNPRLSNLTLVGSPDSTKSDIGILLREGTSASIMNTVVVGFNDACLDIDHSETWDVGAPVLSHSLVQCGTAYKVEKWDCEDVDADADSDECKAGTVATGEIKEPWLVEDWFTAETSNASVAWDDGNRNGVLTDGYNQLAPNFVPSMATSAMPTPGDPTAWSPWFEATTFIGGIDPANDWTQGWTTSAVN